MKEKRKTPRFSKETEDEILKVAEFWVEMIALIGFIALLMGVPYLFCTFWQFRLGFFAVSAVMILAIFTVAATILYRRDLAAKQDDNLIDEQEDE